MKILPSWLRKIVDVNQKPVGIGPRLDIDIAAVVDITRHAFDFVAGLRRSTYQLDDGSTSGAEEITESYFGFRYAAWF